MSLLNFYLSRRQRDILVLLCRSPDPLTLEFLAEEFQVSTRTIRNDLEAVDAFLARQFRARLDRHPRRGVRLDEALRREVESLGLAARPEGPQDQVHRELLTLYLLLFTPGGLTIQKLADALYVSRPTCYAILREVQPKAAEWGVDVRTGGHAGIAVEYREEDWRRLALHLYRELCLRELYVRGGALKPLQSARQDPGAWAVIRGLFPGADVDRAAQLLSRFERGEGFVLSDRDFDRFLLCLVMSQARQRRGCLVQWPDREAQALVQTGRYTLCARLARLMEQEFQTGVEDGEVLFWTQFSLCLHLRGGSAAFRAEYDLEGMVPFAQALVQHVGNVLDPQLARDPVLLEDLLSYVPGVVYRRRFRFEGGRMEPRLLQDVKNNYSQVFAAAWSVNILFERTYDVDLTQDEAGGLALYLAAALERASYRARALVVWESLGGLEETALLQARLKRVLPFLVVVDVLPAHHARLSRRDPDLYDLILSNRPLEWASKPVIQVGPMLSDQNVQELHGAIRKLSMLLRKTTRSEEAACYLLNSSHIFLHLKCARKEEVLRLLCDRLVSSGSVEDGYYETVLEREAVADTDIGHLVAVPHGSPAKVRNSALAVAALDRPIQWGGSRAEWVFLCAFNMEQLEQVCVSVDDFYAVFVDLIQQEGLLKELHASRDPDAFYRRFIDCFQKKDPRGPGRA